METVCIRADISRPTLSKIEAGDSSVSLCAILRVLNVLQLINDVALVAEKDELGRRLQDESLPLRVRAPKSKGSVSENCWNFTSGLISL